MVSMRYKKYYHQLLLLSNALLNMSMPIILRTVKILKFGTPQTIAIIVLKKEKFDVTLH